MELTLDFTRMDRGNDSGPRETLFLASLSFLFLIVSLLASFLSFLRKIEDAVFPSPIKKIGWFHPRPFHHPKKLLFCSLLFCSPGEDVETSSSRLTPDLRSIAFMPLVFLTRGSVFFSKRGGKVES